MAARVKGNHKEAGMDIVRFIENHFDYVDQEEYFDLCEKIMDLVENLASNEGWYETLVRESSMYQPIS